MDSHSVQTSSVIAVREDDPAQVCVIRQSKKHRQRLTLPGGRIEPEQTPLQCIRKEFDEEAAGKPELGNGEPATLDNLTFWALKKDPGSDVRIVTLGKVTFNRCPEDRREELVEAHYGDPDHIYVATVKGTPYPNDGEAKSCEFIDVRTIPWTATEEESGFGAQHDLILMLYRCYLAKLPVDIEWYLGNMNQLRADLPALLAQCEQLERAV